MRIGARNWIGPVSEEAVEERTVEAGRSIARELGDREVVPVHLLVAVASHGGWSAADVLVSVGITGDDLIGSIRFARGELDDWVPGVRPTEPTDEAFAEIKRWEELQETFGSPLRRVIGVGAARTAEGVAVELLALEIREQVMLVHWRAVTASDALLTMPDIAVTDSSGTRYDVFGGEGGGGRHEFRGHFFVMPPPPDSGTLTIEVVSFGRRDWAAYLPDEAEHRGVSGPWRFEIDLAS